MTPRARRLFVYGTLLRGEPGHALLVGARLLVEAATEPAFELVDLGDYPALVPGGVTSVRGEIYLVPAAQIATLDKYEGHPRFYRRSLVRLDGGERAEAYLLRPEQAAGRPRIASGSWRAWLSGRVHPHYPEVVMTEPKAPPGVVVWITGLPSAGKSTLAARLAGRLREAGRPSCTLDGDEVRRALVPAPGYTPEARDAFYATLARLAALLAAQGLVVVVPATAHREAYRAEARSLAPAFIEVRIDVDADECRRRDAKGLYAATNAGRAAGLPGADLAYEPPAAPDVRAKGGHDEAAVAEILVLLGDTRD